jgi:hypothetical protein
MYATLSYDVSAGPEPLEVVRQAILDLLWWLAQRA